MYQLKFFQRTLHVKFKIYFPEILVIKCDYRLCRSKCRHLGWVRREIGGELIPISIHCLFCEVRVCPQAVRPEKSWPLAFG